jgi:hypothetical protein
VSTLTIQTIHTRHYDTPAHHTHLAQSTMHNAPGLHTTASRDTETPTRAMTLSRHLPRFFFTRFVFEATDELIALAPDCDVTMYTRAFLVLCSITEC